MRSDLVEIGRSLGDKETFGPPLIHCSLQANKDARPAVQKTQDLQSSDVTRTINPRNETMSSPRQIPSSQRQGERVPPTSPKYVVCASDFACRAERNLGIDSTPGKRVTTVRQARLLKFHGHQSERLPRQILGGGAAATFGAHCSSLQQSRSQIAWCLAKRLHGNSVTMILSSCGGTHARVTEQLGAASHKRPYESG